MAETILKNTKERLYMLEILVDHLNMLPNTFQSSFAATSLKVTFKFLNLPPFSMGEDEFLSKKKRKMRHGTIDFTSGQSCVFSKRPDDFQKLIKARPLKVEVYKMNLEAICPGEDTDDEIFICETDISLSGCLCDQFEMAANDKDHLPAPFELRKTYELVDELKKPLGTIDLFLRISRHGDSIVNEFHRKKKSLIFKNPRYPNEFQCFRMLTDQEKAAIKRTQRNDALAKTLNIENATPRAKTVIGLSEVCKDLSRGLKSRSELPEKEGIPRKVAENLTVLPKPPSKTDFLNFNTEKRNFRPKNCHGHLCPDVRRFESSMGYGTCQDITWKSAGDRLRGGGMAENGNNFEKNRQFRTFAVQSMQTLLSGACRSGNQNGSKPGCGCYGELPQNANGCPKKPCQGIDCLIRAFKDTQDFVDGIGKVPGMEGLDLMNPRESPFFNHRHIDLPTTCSPLKPMNSRASLVKKLSNHFLQDFKSLPNPKPVSHYALISKKLKKDEKVVEKLTEDHKKSSLLGPCGEIVCESRKQSSFPGLPIAHLESKMAAMPQKRNKTSKWMKSVRKKSLRNIFPHARDTVSSKNEIRVSKNVLRMVESTGINTKRLCYGHRECVDIRMRVPGNMGWLWNTRDTAGDPKPQVGWKPGAIMRRVWRLLEDAKIEKTEDVPERPLTPIRGKRSKTTRRKNLLLGSRGQWSRRRDRDDEFELPPTLHIHRKNGTYYVTMYPVKREFLNQPELQQTVKPLQFKVTKDKDNDSMTSSSMASDMEFEFSPPTAITRWQKKEEMKDFGSQVMQQQILNDVVDMAQIGKGKRKIGKRR